MPNLNRLLIWLALCTVFSVVAVFGLSLEGAEDHLWSEIVSGIAIGSVVFILVFLKKDERRSASE